MNREQWLEQRRYREGVGFCIQASEVAAILGFDEHRTPLDTYVQKKTGNGIADTDQMLIGRCLEDGIARVYYEKTGRQVFDPGDFTIFQHPDIPWLGATLDRQTWKNDEDSQSIPGVPLELKNAGSYQAHAWKDEIPLWLNIQLQMQMACSGAEWGAYCGIVGGSTPHIGDVDRSQAFIDSTIPILEEFKWRLDNDQPPEPTTAKCLSAVKALYPEDNGETVDLGHEHADLWWQLEDAKKREREAAAQKKEYDAKLRAAIGQNTYGRLPSGKKLSLKTVKNKGGTRVVEPYTYRILRMSK